ncbi:hypothetical protein [Roseateles sp.]|uniref:DUF7673 family protein n=1 Tax=Roseateles sp. TaxID=1971397 RepID=UPI003264B5E4
MNTPTQMTTDAPTATTKTAPASAQTSLPKVASNAVPPALLEQLRQFSVRADDATHRAGQAYARLLLLAEDSDCGQARRIAGFLAATYNGRCFALDPFELRAVDVEISDDMLCCLDALRWARADLHTLIPDGDTRMRAVIKRWGLRWPNGA